MPAVPYRGKPGAGGPTVTERMVTLLRRSPELTTQQLMQRFICSRSLVQDARRLARGEPARRDR